MIYVCFHLQLTKENMLSTLCRYRFDEATRFPCRWFCRSISTPFHKAIKTSRTLNISVFSRPLAKVASNDLAPGPGSGSEPNGPADCSQPKDGQTVLRFSIEAVARTATA